MGLATTELGEAKGLHKMLDRDDNVVFKLKTKYSATVVGKKYHAGISR